MSVSVPAKEQLVVLVSPPGEEGMEEAPGVIVYGLGSLGSVIKEPPLNLQREPPINVYTLRGTHWEVVLWEVPVSKWSTGPEWRATIRTYFHAFLAGGAKVAWLGAEYVPFSDPPYLFDPSCMEGAVLAWRRADGEEGWPLDPYKPYASASVEELRELRRYATGLADVE